MLVRLFVMTHSAIYKKVLVGGGGLGEAERSRNTTDFGFFANIAKYMSCIEKNV